MRLNFVFRRHFIIYNPLQRLNEYLFGPQAKFILIALFRDSICE